MTLPAAATESAGEEAEQQAGRDVEAVFRRLPVLDTYDANMFRLTGLATDAGAAQVRRRREEIEFAARLKVAVANQYGDLAPHGSDPDAVKAAFEAMQSPVTRLVHEAFWLTGQPGSHDAAVIAHVDALRAEAEGPGEQAVEHWRSALTQWAQTLADEDFWQHLRRRAIEADDPRVGGATVVALRTRLRVRVLAPSAALAVAAASADDEEALARHLTVLREAPFDAQVVAEAVRGSCEQIVRAVHDGCAELLASTSDDGDEWDQPDEPKPDVPELGAALVRASAPRLAVLRRVLEAADPMPDALHDEVAGALTRAAVAFVNSGGAAADALPMLVSAAELVRAATTAELVARTTRDLSDGTVLAVVEPWSAAGDPDGARELLRIWQRREPDPARRADIARLAADPRSLRAVMDQAPVRSQYLGCGVRPFGHRDFADETWIETRCVTVLWAPVHPLGAYLADEDFVYAKVPMSAWVRWERLLLPLVGAFGLAWLLVGPWLALALVLAVAVALAGASAVRRRAINAWLDQQNDTTSGDGT